MTDLAPKSTRRAAAAPFWRDVRVLGVLAQAVILAVVLAAAAWIAGNASQNMLRLGGSQFLCRDGTTSFRCAFDFLRLDAQFAISESLIRYDPSDSYARALAVGALNTVKVAVLGIVLATVLGTVTGIARLSSNWLISTVARWYVDLIRNTPLLVQLFFLFFGVIVLFPPIRAALQPFGLPIYLSQRGINLPQPVFMPSFGVWLLFLAAGAGLAALVWFVLGRREVRTGQAINRPVWAALALAVVAVAGWFVAAAGGANNQGFLVSDSAGIATLDDLATTTAVRLGLVDLDELPDALASGVLTADDVETGSLIFCGVEGAPAEANLTAHLRRAGVPYEFERFPGPNEAIGGYVDGDCEALVAPRAVLVAASIPASAIAAVPETPLRFSVPRIEGLNFVGGIKMSPTFAAILIGLVIYTGAFIAEIVRAGIQSVPRGQSEAARALGLSEAQRLRLVVLPQALRVIIPPLTSQYLNLTKNSSLAIAVGFPDLWSVAYTTLNQSGRALQVFLLVMATYLAFSLIISFFLNWYNRRIALVER